MDASDIVTKINRISYPDTVGNVALQLFINQLSIADNARIDYMSEAETVNNLMTCCIHQAQLFVEAIVKIEPISDIYDTNAERVGEAGEPTDRPA